MSSKGAFSIIGNFRSIFVRSKSNLKAVDGLRAMSAIMVVSFHCFYFLKYFVSKEAFFSIVSQAPWYMKWALTADLALEVFFVLSGFLISGLLIQEYQKQGSINYGRFYWRRYLRLTPVYFLLIAIYGAAGGPNAENLWANILYINNFLPMNDIAMTWTWSLAVEEQFYLIFPLLLSLFVLKSKQPMTWFLWLFALSFVFRLIPYYANQTLWQANMQEINFNMELSAQYFDGIYMNLYTRYGSFICGAVVAYLFYARQDDVQKFMQNKWLVNAFTLCSLLLMGFIVFNDIRTNADAWSQNQHRLYLLSFRNLYSVAVAWLVLVCLLPTSGLSKLLNGFLSMRIWYPIAQLSYVIYLIHIFIINSLYATLNNVYKVENRLMETISYGEIVQLFFAAFLISCIMATFTYVFVEKPFMNLRK